MRTPTEGELIDLQRKARSVFQQVDNIADYVANRAEKFSAATCDQIDHAATLAREVSDAVDNLTDFVRRWGVSE